MFQAPRHVLVIRNDKLGDFMLAWPALALLRRNLPATRIAALVPAYTAPLARICPSIDEVILDPGLRGEWRSALALRRLLAPYHFDAVLTLFSRFDTGLACRLAGIPRRYAPATKLAQIFYDRRVPQRRSRSEKPEYEYNLDLARIFLEEQGVTAVQAVAPPYLRFDADEGKRETARRQFLGEQGIESGKQLVFVHAGHGGSASNLAPGQYAELIGHLAAPGRHFVLTAGPAEEDRAAELARQLRSPHSLYMSRDGLVAFAQRLQFADVFISGSTGPLHLAAALDRPTAAFYPRRRSSTALRWQTMNRAERRLAFMPPSEAEENDMRSIDLGRAAAEIAARFLA